MKKMLIINQTKHIGGGEVYASNLNIYLKRYFKIVDVIYLSNNKLVILKKILFCKTDYILWHPFEGFSFLFPLLGFLSGKKNIVMLYGIWQKELEANKIFGFKPIVKMINQYLLCLFSYLLIHLSNYSQALFLSSLLNKTLKHKKQIIINGAIDKKTFFTINEKEKKRQKKQLGIDRETEIIIMSGRIDRRKNFLDGLLIFKNILKRNKKKNLLLYLIVSSGSYNIYPYLSLIIEKIDELKIGNYVRIISGIDNHSIAKYFQIGNLSLMLSKNLETYGLVTLESIMCGCPVFGYHACATPEIINTNTKFFLGKNISEIINLIQQYFLIKNSSRKKILNQIIKKHQESTWNNVTRKIYIALNSNYIFMI